MHDKLAQEWITLQDNHEAYERSALFIKLLAVGLAALGAWFGLDRATMVMVLLILWCQEAVLKTWQSRLADRLVLIERAFAPENPAGCAPFQLHAEFLSQRAGLSRQVMAYACSARRPTVAFPYVVLLPWVMIF